jgi:hypothetical protein
VGSVACSLSLTACLKSEASLGWPCIEPGSPDARMARSQLDKHRDAKDAHLPLQNQPPVLHFVYVSRSIYCIRLSKANLPQAGTEHGVHHWQARSHVNLFMCTEALAIHHGNVRISVTPRRAAQNVVQCRDGPTSVEGA